MNRGCIGSSRRLAGAALAFERGVRCVALGALFLAAGCGDSTSSDPLPPGRGGANSTGGAQSTGGAGTTTTGGALSRGGSGGTSGGAPVASGGTTSSGGSGGSGRGGLSSGGSNQSGGAGAASGGSAGGASGVWNCLDAPPDLCFCNFEQTPDGTSKCSEDFECCFATETSCQCADQETCDFALAQGTVHTVKKCPP
jgi:hypothetical protein